MRPRATLGESGVLNLRQDVFKSKTAAPAALGMGSDDLCWANVVGLNGWTANLLRHDPVVPGKGKDMCYWYFCAACIFCMRIILRWKGLVFLHALPSWTLGLLIWPFTDSEALPKDPTLGNWVVIHTHHNIQPPDLENIFSHSIHSNSNEYNTGILPVCLIVGNECRNNFKNGTILRLCGVRLSQFPYCGCPWRCHLLSASVVSGAGFMIEGDCI